MARKGLAARGSDATCGKPKLGKSCLALQLSYAVATGNEVLGRPVEQGRVLYATLEDNPRGLKSRLQKSAPPYSEWPEALSLVTERPRLDQGGLEQFEAWIEHTPDARRLIIDTLATVRSAGNSRESHYQADYTTLRGLHQLTTDTGLSIIAVHHARKVDADDPSDTVSGSTGMTGAADATLILNKTADGVVLCGRGRDLPEFESAVSFDPDTCVWTDLGRPSDVFSSETRKAIRLALKARMQTPTEIAGHGGLDNELCAKTLQRTAEGGEIEKGGRGRYRLSPDPLVQ